MNTLELRSTRTDLKASVRVGPTTADIFLREIPDELIGAARRTVPAEPAPTSLGNYS
jgi:hypothetical protein